MVIDKRIDFALMKLVLNGLNNKSMSEDLLLKLSKEKPSLQKNSVMLVHQNKNIKPVYNKSIKQFNDLPNEKQKNICAMSFPMFKNKLKNYIAKILSCS